MSQSSYDLVSFGEILADFPAEGSPVLGESAAKAACTASCLGMKTAFYGKAGTENFGEQLRQLLSFKGVNTDNFLLSPEPSGQAGEDTAEFYSKGCTEAKTELGDFNLEPIEGSRFFYFTSSMAAHESMRNTGKELIEYARRYGNTMVLSANMYPDLWENYGVMKQNVLELLPLMDSGIVKLSSSELPYLMGETNTEKAAAKLMQQYHPRILLVTVGKKGCMLRSVYGDLVIPGFPTREERLTSPTEDVFTGAFLSRLSSNGKALKECSIGDIASCVIFANAAVSFAAESGNPYPNAEEVETFLTKCLMGA